MGQYLRTVKGYNGGWSGASTDLKVSNGSTFESPLNGFYSDGSAWKRFYTGINIANSTQSSTFGLIFPDTNYGLAEYTFYSNGHSRVFGGPNVSSGHGSEGFDESVRWDSSTTTPDAGDFEIYATLTSSAGNVDYGTYNTWLNCSTTRTWGGNTDPQISGSWITDFELRHIPSNIIVATWFVTADLLSV